jgi:chloramphenicol O-acetyltransferase type A
MKYEIDPKETNRAQAFSLWMTSPMPMVTLTKTFDVTRIQKVSRQRRMKFNMLLCWCVGKAASQIDEFYTLPEGGKLFRYDRLAVNVIVNNSRGGINSCDIPYSDDLEQFNADYAARTQATAESCENTFEDGAMIVGTSAMTATELDCIVNQYTDKFSNPMLMWGRYRKGLFKTTLPISFQFHHVQMDGGEAAKFLERLQQTLNVKFC